MDTTTHRAPYADDSTTGICGAREGRASEDINLVDCRACAFLDAVTRTIVERLADGYHLALASCNGLGCNVRDCGDCESCNVTDEHSVSPCGLCGTPLHGSREPLAWIKPGEEVEVDVFGACRDCVFFHANGDLPESV